VKHMAKAIAFPGQGVQAVGMDRLIRGTSAWERVAEASDILGFELARLMAEGPEDKLQQTQYAQPAVFVTCFALWQLCCAGEEPAAYVGHSLGEVTALAAAGAFTFAQGVELVAKRSECMAEPRGGMLAILGLEVEELESLCSQVQEEHWVQVANINAPGQIVVSGKEEGLAVVAGLAKERGARRVVPLKVSGPFHSQLMAPAAEAFGRYVAQLRIQDVTVPVVSNHTSELLSSGEQIRAELVDQLTRPVRFTENCQALAKLGVDSLIEVSPSPVVGPLARRTVSTLKITLASPGGM
jgi:[acyl-carrier-protein] S-malonyltransferase